jgi:hypothetical protein
MGVNTGEDFNPRVHLYLTRSFVGVGTGASFYFSPQVTHMYQNFWFILYFAQKMIKLQ